MVFLLDAVNTVAGVDLTPNMAETAAAPAPEVSSPTPQPQVIQIQDDPPANQVVALVPVTGGCSDPYTVRSGDTLSKIAVNCNTTLAFLSQINPQMPNVDCMYPGQQINIHNNTAQPFAPCRQAAPIASVPVTASVPVVALPEACTWYTGQVPVGGVYPMINPGSGLLVTALNFPLNTIVDVAIGPRDTVYNVVASGVTDANGTLTTQIIVPSAPDSRTVWVVVLTTTSEPMQIVSRPFTIGL